MGFLAPWFLGGLAALGVPIFVHLLRKHITVPRPVSSLMFFERGIQSSTRHRRLKHLLLFALRFALVLLVVLAFANPFVRRASADANSRMLLIVLDHSFSMKAGTRFADAKQQALATLAAKPHGGKAQIVALGGEVELLTQPITDDTQLRAALESIQPGDGHANFGELGRAVRALTETVHSPIDLHLFSDMQHSAMPASFGDMIFPPSVKLTLRDVAKGEAPPDWTVESVNAPAELADPKDPKLSRVEAVVVGFNTPTASKTVSLLIAGKVVATSKVNIPASGRATVEFKPLNVAYGFNRCAVRIDSGDAFPADDATVFSVRRSDPERVLFVHAAKDARARHSILARHWARLRSRATCCSPSLQSRLRIWIHRSSPSWFSQTRLSFHRFLSTRAGGVRRQEERSNVLMAVGTSDAHSARIPLWGGRTQDARDYVRNGDGISVGQVDFSYPALAQEQPGRDNGGWPEVKVHYAAVVDAAGARVAARLTDGTPFVLD